MVSDRGVESYLKITRRPPVDRYGQVRRALYPYSSEFGVHAGALLVGSRPGWPPDGPVRVRSLAASDSHTHVTRPSVWPAPPTLPPSPVANGETDPQWVG